MISVIKWTDIIWVNYGELKSGKSMNIYDLVDLWTDMMAVIYGQVWSGKPMDSYDLSKLVAAVI